MWRKSVAYQFTPRRERDPLWWVHCTKWSNKSVWVSTWPCQRAGRKTCCREVGWGGGVAGSVWMFALWINSGWPTSAMIEEFFIQFALIYPLVSMCLLFFNETIFTACCFRCCEWRRVRLFFGWYSIFCFFRVPSTVWLLLTACAQCAPSSSLSAQQVYFHSR